jgi:hypothetical protein
MRRPFVTTTFALALALAPAVLFAQATPPAQTPPAQTPPGQPPAAAGQPPAAAATAPKLPFTADAGLLLVQIKPDQTAAFEELITKLKAGMAKSADPVVKQQAAGWKVFKAGEPMGSNALYVIVIDPAIKQVEYDLFGLLQKTMTPEELRAPEATEMFKKFAGAFAAGYNKLNLTPLK